MPQRQRPRPRDPDPFERWWPRLRDVGCAIFGAYLLNEQAGRSDPSEAITAVGAMLLVVPAASLAQRWLRGKIDENGNGDDDRWSHLP